MNIIYIANILFIFQYGFYCFHINTCRGGAVCGCGKVKFASGDAAGIFPSYFCYVISPVSRVIDLFF